MATAYAHMPLDRGDGGAFERLARSDAQEIADRGADTLEGVADVSSRVATGGTLAEALRTLAENEHADLLVVAASSRPHIAGHQPGGVTEHVVNHSPCPVTVVPGSDREPRFACIGVALDDSPAARAALGEAVALASACESRLTLLHFVPADTRYLRPGIPVASQEQHPELGWLRTLAAEIGEKASVVTRGGDPGKQLAQLSEELDLIVIGSRDHGPLKRLLLGSVSTHVVRHAHCPIVVVPASARRSRRVETAHGAQA